MTPFARTVQQPPARAVLGSRALLVLAAAGVVAAACGSSTKSTTSGSGSAPTSAATSAAGSGGGAYGGYGGYGGSTSSAPASTGGAMLATRHTSLGTFLVDGSGHTLYLFEADRTSTSTCTGACAMAWPPLLAASGSMPTAGTGLQANLISTSARSDGTRQVTYGGHPLYDFSGDRTATDVNGQGSTAFGAKWYVVAPTGKKIDNS